MVVQQSQVHRVKIKSEVFRLSQHATVMPESKQTSRQKIQVLNFQQVSKKLVVPAHAQRTGKPPCPAWTSRPRCRRRGEQRNDSPAGPPGPAYASASQSNRNSQLVIN